MPAADKPRAPRAKPEYKVPLPAELDAALATDAAARAAFAAMPPSHQREYADHVAEAKKPETRAARARKCLAMIAASRRGAE